MLLRRIDSFKGEWKSETGMYSTPVPQNVGKEGPSVKKCPKKSVNKSVIEKKKVESRSWNGWSALDSCGEGGSLCKKKVSQKKYLQKCHRKERSG